MDGVGVASFTIHAVRRRIHEAASGTSAWRLRCWHFEVGTRLRAPESLCL